MIIDTSGVGITEFRLGEDKRQKLLRQGRDAADAFLARWNARHPQVHAGRS